VKSLDSLGNSEASKCVEGLNQVGKSAGEASNEDYSFSSDYGLYESIESAWGQCSDLADGEEEESIL